MQEIRNIGLHERLTARHGNALDYPLPLFKISEDLILRILALLRRVDDETCILAKRASEITAGGEYGAGGFAREIKQSELLQTLNIHQKSFFQQ